MKIEDYCLAPLAERRAHDAEVEAKGCRDWRIEHGIDVVIEHLPEGILTKCVSGLHVGCFTLWGDNNKPPIRIGTEHWARTGKV